MKWVKKNIQGKEETWYSEDEIIKYKSCLVEIRNLKISLGIKDDALKMINRVLDEEQEL